MAYPRNRVAALMQHSMEGTQEGEFGGGHRENLIAKILSIF